MRVAVLVIAGLIALGALRIVTTLRVFSATVDEATHVGAGLDLLARHCYDVQHDNPPLPRLLFAIGPYLSGARFNIYAPGFYAQLHSVFYGVDKYERIVSRARAGNLVFFLIAAVALAAWTRRELDDFAAIIATLLFTMEPIVLGYSGLATHDVAQVAGTAMSLLAFSRWLARPTRGTAIVLGIAYGFAILCKLSCLAFVPVACAAIAAVRWRSLSIRSFATLWPVPLVTAAMLWAGYAFTFGHVDTIPFRVPAPALVDGIRVVVAGSRGEFDSYAFGHIAKTGWWWYFPVALLLKTTLPLLVLLAFSAFIARDGRTRMAMAEGGAAACAILLIALPSHADIGVRYVLPVYVPLVFAAAAGAAAMVRDARRIHRATAYALFAATVIVSASAHPDYFPYFNALAGSDPSRCLIDSNLDWGQDVLRLRSEVRANYIRSLGVQVMGNHDYAMLGFPDTHEISPSHPEHGWIAVSDHGYRMGKGEGGYSWLPTRPLRRVGSSISLYYLP